MSASWGGASASLRNQLGIALDEFREAVKAGDLQLMTVLLRDTIANCEPYLSESEVKELKMPSGFVRSRAGADARFEALQVIKGRLLRICSEHGVYAYLEPPEGDASAAALGADDGGAAADAGVGE